MKESKFYVTGFFHSWIHVFMPMLVKVDAGKLTKTMCGFSQKF